MTISTHPSSNDLWLPLAIASWQDTYETLHLWTALLHEEGLRKVERW